MYPHNTNLLHLCVVELSNSQLAMQGTDTEGFVMVTSAMSRILNYEHKPQWREGDLRIKKSWVAKVEEMQVSRLVILHIFGINFVCDFVC